MNICIETYQVKRKIISEFIHIYRSFCPGLWTYKSWIQWCGRLRFPWQVAYKTSKLYKKFILESGYYWPYIFEVWHGLAIWINLSLLGNSPNKSIFCYFIPWQNWGQVFKIKINVVLCSRHVEFLWDIIRISPAVVLNYY